MAAKTLRSPSPSFRSRISTHQSRLHLVLFSTCSPLRMMRINHLCSVAVIVSTHSFSMRACSALQDQVAGEVRLLSREYEKSSAPQRPLLAVRTDAGARDAELVEDAVHLVDVEFARDDRGTRLDDFGRDRAGERTQISAASLSPPHGPAAGTHENSPAPGSFAVGVFHFSSLIAISEFTGSPMASL